MSESEPRSPFESFHALQQVQAELERQGYYFYPIEKETAEALITDPLLRCIRTDIKKRGFAKLAGRAAITFSGYAYDPREIFEIPEARAYWQQLDQQLPELPALLTQLPRFQYNGPGQHLTLLGTIEQMVDRPDFGGYDVQVLDGPAIIADALRRIRQAGAKYRLPPPAVSKLAADFVRGAESRFP
jgi:hypothetical protein